MANFDQFLEDDMSEPCADCDENAPHGENTEEEMDADDDADS